MTAEEFGALVEQTQRERIAREYPRIDLNSDQYRIKVTRGPKYTRVDFGGSGLYMIVNATGEIFGIKAYGVIHRGHRYGTLATAREGVERGMGVAYLTAEVDAWGKRTILVERGTCYEPIYLFPDEFSIARQVRAEGARP